MTTRSTTPKAKIKIRKFYLIGLAAIVIAGATFIFFEASQPKELEASTVVAAIACTDSDGGFNYYKKGTTSGRSWVDDDTPTSRNDFCVVLSGSAVELSECSGDNCGVYEFACSYKETGSYVNGNVEPCPNGCSDGACIVDSTNEPPVIDGLSTTTSLDEGEKGTWTITAHDPDGSYLNYSVDWGDSVEAALVADTDLVEATQGQITTFTHSYSIAGNYTITFMVADEDGATATSTTTVQVTNSDTSCAKEGEQYSGIFVDEYPENCCAGLTEWEAGMDTRKVENGECVETGMVSGWPVGICLNCGNGVCETIEDLCNCPEDCAEAEEPICASDTKTCPNGLIVSRTGADCSFACPVSYEDEVITNPVEGPNPFSDTSLDTLEGEAAAELHSRGVIGGFADGEFKGDRLVNRAEAAKFLLLVKGISVGELTNSGKFPDVKEGEWYVSFVMKAAEKGIINGYENGNFGPADSVTTAQFLKMITKTFGLSTNLSYSYADISNSDWVSQFAGVAQKYELFPDRGNRLLQPDSELTRYEVAVAIYQCLLNQ